MKGLKDLYTGRLKHHQRNNKDTNDLKKLYTLIFDFFHKVNATQRNLHILYNFCLYPNCVFYQKYLKIVIFTLEP